MRHFLFVALLPLVFSAKAQSRFATADELSINGFRNPSIGAEYRHGMVSGHAGYYVTNFTSGVTTQFLKTGVTLWVLPVGQRQPVPSSFYVGVSYLRGLNRDYENRNASAAEVGFRWMVWRGLNLRIGAIALAAKGQDIKINPTPGISYAFLLRGRQ